METRPMPPPPSICPTSLPLHRSADAAQSSVPFAAFSSLGQQQQLNCVIQQNQMASNDRQNHHLQQSQQGQQQQQQLISRVADNGLFQMGGQQQQQKGKIVPSKVVDFHQQEVQTISQASLQSPPLSVPTSASCTAFDYFSLFLPQQELFHPFGEVPPSSSLAGEGLPNPGHNGGGPYLCEDPASSSASSASSLPSFCSTAYSSAPAKTSAASTKSHDRKRPYPCSTCDSRFGSKMELEEHQNSHTGMKPFQCDVCQSRFNRRSTLWNHKRIHSDAKPFKCTVCQMQFKWKNSLKCHKEMHLRKNELSQGTVPDTDSQLLTYATAAKKTMGSSESIGGASSVGAVLPPTAMALLPYSAAPSRLLTCAGTPRKRAPPRNGGGNGKGLKVGKTNGPTERRKDVGGAVERTATVETATEAQAQQFGINLLPFGVGEVPEMAQLRKEPKYMQHAEELAALRREQALQQRHSQQQHSAGSSLFPLQCAGGALAATGNNDPQNTASVSQQQQQNFFPLSQQMPFMMDQQQQQHAQPRQQSLANNNANIQQHQSKAQFQPQQHQLDLQLGQLVDTSFLLQDFHLAQSATAGQVGTIPPFLGLDLQQQLNSLATAAQPTTGADLLNSSAVECNPSTQSSSTAPTSVSVLFSSPSVPCTSSSSFLVPASSFSNSFANVCHSTTEVLLNGYTHHHHHPHNHQQQQQFDPHPMRFLPSATKEQQKNSANFVNDRQQSIGYDIFCTAVNGGAVELDEFELRNNGAQFQTYGQHHFPSADQFGIDQQQIAHISSAAGQILERKRIKAEEQPPPPPGSTTVGMSF